MTKSFTYDKMGTITQEQFTAYEKVRDALPPNETNMWDFEEVVELSGLPLDIVYIISQNYSDLRKKFLGAD